MQVSSFVRHGSLLLGLLVLFASLSGCGGSRSAAGVLEAVCESLASLPSGAAYSLVSSEDAERALPGLDKGTCAALFGMSQTPPELSLLEDGAIYLSHRGTHEFAVLLCRRAADTHVVAELMQRRLDSLRAYHTANTSGTPSPTGQILIRGRWVFLCFADDPARPLEAFRRMV